MDAMGVAGAWDAPAPDRAAEEIYLALADLDPVVATGVSFLEAAPLGDAGYTRRQLHADSVPRDQGLPRRRRRWLNRRYRLTALRSTINLVRPPPP